MTNVISHPIDVVKTRLQVSGEGTRNYKALGIGGTVNVIFVEEGKTFFQFHHCCCGSTFIIIYGFLPSKVFPLSGKELEPHGFVKLRIHRCD